MNEPLFGSVSPSWPSMPLPPAGWPPTSFAGGNRPYAGSPLGISAFTAPPGFAGSLAAHNPGGAAPASLYAQAPGVATIGAAIPGFVSADIAVGITAPALLATVAVRRGQPLGPTNDLEIEDFIYDALELVPGSSDVEVRCEGGRVTLTGAVQHKRLKRDVGEIAWAIPTVSDVQNNVTIATRRRPRAPNRESESPGTVTRKSA